MSSQPPSFEPRRHGKRPTARGAAQVGRGRIPDTWSPSSHRGVPREVVPREQDRVSGPAKISGQPRASEREKTARSDHRAAHATYPANSSGAPVYQPKQDRSVRPQPQPVTPQSHSPQRASTHQPGQAGAAAAFSQSARRPANHVRPSDASGPSGSSGPSGPSDPSRPSSPSQGASLISPRKRRRPRRWIVSILVVALVAVVGWPLFLLQYGNSKMDHLAALSGAEDTPGTTYLIVGSDKRQEEAINDGTEGQRADTLMLLQVPASGAPALISLPRDSWVDIPGYGEDKINASYAIGGPELLVQTVENLSGMTVDHYLEVSMFGVQDLVDGVGGINLCLDYDVVHDDFSGLEWQAGCHDVNGHTALAFSRMRYSDPQGDIGRTLRQRQVVTKLIGKAASPSTLINPVRQYTLVGKAASNLTGDEDTSLLDIAKAGLGLRSVMGEGGLMGTPPISTIEYWTESGQVAVLLDPDNVDDFFARMRDGQLTSADFQQ